LFWRSDPLEHADVIHVLAGSRMDRQLEAGLLYKEGYAPVIVLTREDFDDAERHLETLGVKVESGAQVAQRYLTQLGIPPSAFIVPPTLHDNTAQEAATLRQLAVAHRWRTVILVTSGYHTRRSGYAFERALRGTGVRLIVRPTRFDSTQPARWWRSRDDIRWILSEGPKFAAYLLGLGE
jgi:uncharacterized SAM-binding protein YcdF (DUF218 family)